MVILILGGRWHTNDRHPLAVADTVQEAETWLRLNAFTKVRDSSDRRKFVPGQWTREGTTYDYWARLFFISDVNETTFDGSGVEEVLGFHPGQLKRRR